MGSKKIIIQRRRVLVGLFLHVNTFLCNRWSIFSFNTELLGLVSVIVPLQGFPYNRGWKDGVFIEVINYRWIFYPLVTLTWNTERGIKGHIYDILPTVTVISGK